MATITEDNIKQPEYDPFDAPIPGQSLTDEPGNYPWEHAPQFTDVDEVIGNLYDSLTKPNIARQLIAMLDAGVPVEAIVRVITFGGFMEGKYEMQNDNGDMFDVKIPQFSLDSPFEYNKLN